MYKGGNGFLLSPVGVQNPMPVPMSAYSPLPMSLSLQGAADAGAHHSPLSSAMQVAALPPALGSPMAAAGTPQHRAHDEANSPARALQSLVQSLNSPQATPFSPGAAPPLSPQAAAAHPRAVDAVSSDQHRNDLLESLQDQEQKVLRSLAGPLQVPDKNTYSTWQAQQCANQAKEVAAKLGCMKAGETYAQARSSLDALLEDAVKARTPTMRDQPCRLHKMPAGCTKPQCGYEHDVTVRDHEYATLRSNVLDTLLANTRRRAAPMPTPLSAVALGTPVNPLPLPAAANPGMVGLGMTMVGGSIDSLTSPTTNAAAPQPWTAATSNPAAASLMAAAQLASPATPSPSPRRTPAAAPALLPPGSPSTPSAVPRGLPAALSSITNALGNSPQQSPLTKPASAVFVGVRGGDASATEVPLAPLRLTPTSSPIKPSGGGGAAVVPASPDAKAARAAPAAVPQHAASGAGGTDSRDESDDDDCFVVNFTSFAPRSAGAAGAGGGDAAGDSATTASAAGEHSGIQPPAAAATHGSVKASPMASINNALMQRAQQQQQQQQQQSVPLGIPTSRIEPPKLATRDALDAQLDAFRREKRRREGDDAAGEKRWRPT